MKIKSNKTAEVLQVNSDFIRESLIEASTIRTAPELVNVRWNILVQKETEAIKGLSEDHILLLFTVLTDEGFENVKIGMDIGQLHQLMRSLAQINASLQGFEADLDYDPVTSE